MNQTQQQPPPPSQQQPQQCHTTAMTNHDHPYGGGYHHQQHPQMTHGDMETSAVTSLQQHDQQLQQQQPQQQQPQQYMYHASSSSQPQAPPPQQQPLVQTPDLLAGFSNNSGDGLIAAASSSSTSAGPAAPSHLDHALLESLFYNEMVLLESSTSSPTSSNTFAHHFAEATHPQDPTTIVEKEILRDFGVGTPQRPAPTATTDPAAWQQQQAVPHPGPIPPQPSSSTQYQPPSYPHPLEQQHHQQHLPPHSAAGPPPPTHHHPQQSPSYAAAPPSQPQFSSSMVHPDPHAAAMMQPPIASGAAPHGGYPHGTVATYTAGTAPGLVTTAAPLSSSPPALPPPPPLQTEPPVTSSNSTSYQMVVPQGRARQLVDQFATLASRLGIDLPDTVLESLTAAAAKNDPSLVQQQQETSNAATAQSGDLSSSNNATVDVAANRNAASAQQPSAISSSTSVAQDENAQSGNGSNSHYAQVALPVAPTVAELRKTAEEAIAAVTTDRKRALEHQDSAGSDGGYQDDGNNDNDDSNEAGSTNTKSSGNKPAYSKRRKKPRLAECESKLAQLKAENEQLKRHLENVSNKAHKFDKGKEEAGRRIAQLQHKNAGPNEMTAAVREFSDMYSDYGVNRQQELSFHLEQLQRLVNPTNFTKMGLWTLGQSDRDPKRNPIAGILVKELTITPQQGRKILDQSEKIRKLCDNLKETHALLVKLKALCDKKTQIFQDRMSKCTQILSSQQVVKLISWINEHTQLLGSVCPGWGTEQIISSKKPAAKK